MLPFEIASPLSRFYLLLLPLLFLAIPAWSLIKNGYTWYMSSRVINQKVKVSTGYLPAYFDLRNHMRYVMGRLQERRDALLTQQGSASGQTIEGI